MQEGSPSRQVDRTPRGFSRRLFLTGAAATGAALVLPRAGLLLPSSAHAAENGRSWDVQSVDMMKVTQDFMRTPADTKHIDAAMEFVDDVGATHVAIETMYDSGGRQFDQIGQTQTWVDVIRVHNKGVVHRHTDTRFQGFYDQQKKDLDFTHEIYTYIVDNPGFFATGDIFAPFPEPQNGGVNGLNGCEQNVCQYESVDDFNRQLQAYIEVSKEAFKAIGFNEGDIRVGYYGFDGFVVAGLNNPDWEGKSFLTPETVAALGNVITVDHYPDDGDSIGDDYRKMEAVWPDAQFAVGEFGPKGHADASVSDEDMLEGYRRDLEALQQDERIIFLNAWPFLGGDDRESGILYVASTDSFVPGMIYDSLRAAFRPQAA